MDDNDVHRISAAPRSGQDDLNQRMKRYLWSMGFRTVCVILTVVIEHPVRWVFAVAAVGVPYFAVIIANGPNRLRSAPLEQVQHERPALRDEPEVAPGKPEVIQGSIIDPPPNGP